MIPEKNQYLYKLEGFDKNWTKGDASRKAIYTNLDPGKYTFHLKASNNDGIWNESGKKLTLIINPPWWETWWFRILIIFLFLLLTFVIYFLRVSSIKERNRILEQKVLERTKQLQEANTNLSTKNIQINTINKQLQEQKEEIESQKNKIEVQNKALETNNQKLEALNVSKDRFFSIIGHDLRGPLGTIVGFSDLILTDYVAPTQKELHKFIKVINVSSKNLYNLLENLLNWALSQTDSIKFKPFQVNLNEIITECISLLQSLANDKEIEIRNHTQPNCHVYADENMISVVIRNIISNAIKFSYKKSTITIKTSEHIKTVEIKITDNGVGMNPEKILSLFKLDKSVSTKGTNEEKGTGLGLIVCKEFVEKNEGKLLVKSEVDKGSEFTIILPKQQKVKI